jgi:aspartyl-tRNA(Asn)/glutamyl-tRNA(Gln) amidotransferase subunit B
VSDESAIESLVDQAIRDNPGPVSDIRRGKAAAAKFLVGQVIKLSKGKADPQAASRILARRLGVETGSQGT